MRKSQPADFTPVSLATQSPTHLLTYSPTHRWVLALSFAVMAITLIPYLFGYSLLGINRQFGWFSWLGYNLDDGTVYLSWIRQAADGHFFQRNLFTTESQPSGQFNLFFLALGFVCRITTLEPISVWHISRILLGIALLVACFRLFERTLIEDRARKSAFLFLCFSAGFGWIPDLWHDIGQTSPVDVWQVEAVTFLSLYLNPLFIISMLLMVLFLTGLLDSESRGTSKPAVIAGLCGFLLGNIHGYDVITLAVIWATYLAVRLFAGKRIPRSLLLSTAIAFIPAFLSASYQYYLLKSNPVFAARVNVETLSPPLTQYLLGYGLLIPLAVAGARILRRKAEDDRTDRSDLTDSGIQPETPPPLLHSRVSEPASGPRAWDTPLLFLIAWAVANLAVAYLPVPFQRKMIMGFHIPLCILAGSAIGRWFASTPPLAWRAGLAVTVLLTSITNVRFLMRDLQFFQSNIAQSLIQRPYLMEGERRSLEWIRKNAKPGEALQPLPWIPLNDSGKLDTTMAALAPGLTGHPVAAGHWGETPYFGDSIKSWGRFARGMPLDAAAAVLRESGVRYVISSQKLEPALALPAAYTDSASPLLRTVPEASNADADVYEVLSR